MMGSSLVVQWIRLSAFTAVARSIPGQGTKIQQAAEHGQEKKKKATSHIFLSNYNSL